MRAPSGPPPLRHPAVSRRLGAIACLAAAGCAGVAEPDRGAAATSARGARAQPALAEPHRKESSEAEPSVARGSPGEPAPTAAEEPARDERPRITSHGYVTWIWPRPSTAGTFLGYVRAGDSLPVRSTQPVRGQGCGGGFLPVEPRGYVCLDRTATLSPAARFAEAADATRASPGPFPFRYAISNGAPMYNRIPTPAEQGRFEKRFGPAGKWQPLIKSLSSHEDLAVAEPIPAVDPLPPFLSGGRPTTDERMGLLRQTIPLGSMLSFTRAFEAEGRTWLLSADLTLVPADRTRPFRPGAFRGARLGGDVRLPIAWIRREPRPRYRVSPSGGVAAAGGDFAARTFVQLTGRRVDDAGVVYLETREREPAGGALYIAERDATVVEAATKLPSGVAVDQKWMHVRVTQGTLVAYEGLTPVYATLMSPGAGGVSVKGRDPVKDSTTPRGTYYVTFKDRAATMSPEKGLDRSLWIADVPHTQYFNPPFAIHAAYWHERFGEPTSAGCVNLSPVDAEALFAWSDPPVPEGWQGATGSGARENGPTTAVVVHR